MKIGISRERGVELVIVTAENLSYGGMRAKIGDLLPLRDLDEDDPVVKYLEGLSKAYRAKALGASRRAGITVYTDKACESATGSSLRKMPALAWGLACGCARP